MCTSPTPKYASVVLDHAVDKELDYSIPLEMQNRVQVGCRVLVPVKTSLRKGTVWQIKETAQNALIRPIAEILSESSVLSSDLIFLGQWMSRYYCTPMHKVLKTLLPASIRSHMKEQTQRIVKKAKSKEALAEACQSLRHSYPQQAVVLECLLQHPDGIFLSDLLEKTKVSQSPVASLEKKGLVKIEWTVIDRMQVLEQEYFLTKPKTLTLEQSQSLEKIKKALDEQVFSPHLLHGVTGSGKTEIYLQAIELALKQKKGIIFLVPEIILTSQTIERLKSRFEEKIAILHHRLSEGEKRDSWHHILSGKAPIVIGARSAVFCPVPNLGLIIVDEEHENAYKQSEEPPCYHARDVAVMRAKLCNATVLLGSATPSLESYLNAKEGRYILSALSHRPNTASLPQVHIVDMKQECLKKKGFTLFSDALLSGIKQRILNGEQTMLLLNRRGYHTSQICLHCSHISSCPHCEAPLTFHLNDNILACHLCDYRIPPPKTCTQCSHDSPLKFKGAGTEMVEKALYSIFPECRVLRMDADSTRLKGSHEALFRKFRSGKADILVGTQMIAKGLHFPSVTLVGVLQADLTLNIPDFRASENLFQLITQVAGRSGRSEIPGEVIIQTFLPEHATLIQAAKQDYHRFFQEESDTRKAFLYPPYTHLIKLVFSGLEEETVFQKALEARAYLIRALPPSFEFLPVTPCGYAKIQDKYRFQFLVKTDKISPASSLLSSLRNRFKNQEVKIFIDVDPVSTFF